MFDHFTHLLFQTTPTKKKNVFRFIKWFQVLNWRLFDIRNAFIVFFVFFVLLSEKNTWNFSVFQRGTFLIVTYPFVLEIQWIWYQNGFEEKPLTIIRKDFCPSSIVMYFWSNISDIFMHNKQNCKSIHVVLVFFLSILIETFKCFNSFQLRFSKVRSLDRRLWDIKLNPLYLRSGLFPTTINLIKLNN